MNLSRLGPERTASFDVNAAWKFHKKTREQGVVSREAGDLVRRQRELQEQLKSYREAVAQDFKVTLTEFHMPEIFHREDTQLRTKSKEDHKDSRWYKALERMRASELKKNYEGVLQDIPLPAPNGGKLVCTDVGSRSDYFRALMSREHTTEDWRSVEIKDYRDLLPARPPLRKHEIIEPLAVLPKSDIITLNCVLHHVGEDERMLGKYDDAKTRQFIDTVHDALPKNGLVVVTEDFIGKEKEEPVYRDFIKNMDALFYPKALGNQKPSKEWTTMFEDRGFKLEKATYPVAFNVVGFPVVESVLVFRKK